MAKLHRRANSINLHNGGQIAVTAILHGTTPDNLKSDRSEFCHKTSSP